MNFDSSEKDYAIFAIPFIESARKITINREEKEQINNIIFKKINVKNIHEANDIPDFRSSYGKKFVNIALIRFFKENLKNEFFIKVINGSRYLNHQNENILISYFSIGTLPLIDFNHNHHLFVGFCLEKNIIYIFGELNILFKNKKELEIFINKNTIHGGKYFTSFQLLKPFKHA